MQIEGKRIIVTGASAGIGQELVQLLKLREGTIIIAVARNTESIIPIESKVYPFEADLSSKSGVDSLFAFSQKIYGDTDIFIANAGFAYLERLHTPDWEHLENIFSLNVFSVIYSLEKLVQQGDVEKAFIATVSGAGLISLPYYSLYCSTKSALHFFLQTYRYEKTKNIQISAVYPVATQTGFFDKASQNTNTPLPFIKQDIITVAKAIIKGIEKNKRIIYPSMLFRIFYPIVRIFPFFSHWYSLNEKVKNKKRFG